MIVGSGGPDGPKGPNHAAQTATESKMKAAKNISFQIASGTNAIPSVFVMLVLLDIGSLANYATGHRPLVDAEFQNHQKMNAHECDEKSGDDENVESEET